MLPTREDIDLLKQVQRRAMKAGARLLWKQSEKNWSSLPEDSRETLEYLLLPKGGYRSAGEGLFTSAKWEWLKIEKE